MTSPTFLIKRVTAQIATPSLRCFLFYSRLLWLPSGPVVAQEAAAPGFPLFRHIDSVAKPPTGFAQRNIRLLTDRDFPPFSYETPEGKTAGVSVDLALAACAELKATCTVIAKPFSELLPALLNNEGDVIVSGLRIDETVLKKAAMTRAYFWSLGRFAVRVGSQLRGSDIRSLAGRRIGYGWLLPGRGCLRPNLPAPDPAHAVVKIGRGMRQQPAGHGAWHNAAPFGPQMA